MRTRIGICSILAGLFLGIFTGISQLMGVKNYWIDLTLSKLCGPERTEAIINWFNSVYIQDRLDSLFYDAPLFSLLIFTGIICLVISFLAKEK